MLWIWQVLVVICLSLQSCRKEKGNDFGRYNQPYSGDPEGEKVIWLRTTHRWVKGGGLLTPDRMARYVIWHGFSSANFLQIFIKRNVLNPLIRFNWGRNILGVGINVDVRLKPWGRRGGSDLLLWSSSWCWWEGVGSSPPSHVVPHRHGPRGCLASRKHKREDSLLDCNHAALMLLELPICQATASARNNSTLILGQILACCLVISQHGRLPVPFWFPSQGQPSCGYFFVSAGVWPPRLSILGWMACFQPVCHRRLVPCWAHRIFSWPTAVCPLQTRCLRGGMHCLPPCSCPLFCWKELLRPKYHRVETMSRMVKQTAEWRKIVTA